MLDSRSLAGKKYKLLPEYKTTSKLVQKHYKIGSQRLRIYSKHRLSSVFLWSITRNIFLYLTRVNQLNQG